MFSMKNANERRQHILSYIRNRTDQGHPPTLAEIAAACGLASKSAAQKHVKALQEAGLLEADAGKARGARTKSVRKGAGTGLSPFFEVAPSHIATLASNDADFRELIARLAMARLAAHGFPPNYVTWGGNQRAPDGGVDVRVQMPIEVAKKAGFSRKLVGIQVKAMKMPDSEIRKEMRPGGVLRPSIQEIIRGKGEYIIASSESVTDKPYQDRVAAMNEAASSEKGAEGAEYSFYDAQRLADWTNQHPGVVAWVRQKIGHGLQGWRPHGHWAINNADRGQGFLQDELPRFSDPAEPDKKHSLAEGVQTVRGLLKVGGKSVRIAGLSGVGKTRFVQALFEEDSLPGAVSPDLVIYTDTSESPVPTPLAVMDELLATGRRTIMVVDNCSSQLHSQLTARCKSSGCVNLVTVEYDIREDFPDETKVFRLEAGSSDLVAKVIEQQFPHVSQVNRSTIAKFAEGNSRVAIALANTLDRKDSLAGISNRGLFDRLFWQGREVNQELLTVARICSLVYSFNAEEPDDELARLARLAGIDELKFYRYVDELLKRGLAQRRGPWRAILPHAIANTLAIQGLSEIPPHMIGRLTDGHSRLLKSHSRRLGYLDKSEHALSVVRKWFEKGNLLGDVADLTEPLSEVLHNVAPLDPEATLQAIERAVNGPDGELFVAPDRPGRSRMIRLVRSIAYDAVWFDRCVSVLLRYALAEPENTNYDSTRDIIKSLFSIYLSGTHATLAQRLTWIRGALGDSDARVREIGRRCLHAALESHHFISHYGFDFGARPRNFGAQPRGKAVQEWFDAFIELAVDFGVRPDGLALEIRDVLASHFRSLWTNAGMADALEKAVPRLLAVGWEKGWVAIKKTIQFDLTRLPGPVQDRLKALELASRPINLVDRVKAIVLGTFLGSVDFSDEGETEEGRTYLRAESRAHELGTRVVQDAKALAEVLPLMVVNHQGRHWKFGEGMASAAPDPVAIWEQLVLALEAISPDLRNVQILRGYLHGVQKRDPELFERFMDAAMVRKSLIMWTPVLQLSCDLNDSGCVRLLKMLDDAAVPATLFANLSLGRATENVPEAVLSEILGKLANKSDGLPVAVDVLAMHVFDNKSPIGPELSHRALELIAQVTPENGIQRLDHDLKTLILKFMRGPEAEPYARALLKNIRECLDNYKLSPYDIDDLLPAIFEVQPYAALDELVGDETDEEGRHVNRRELRAAHAKNPIGGVSVESLIDWCSKGGTHRWEHVADVMPAFQGGAGESYDHNPDSPNIAWTPSARALLERAPEPSRVAEILARQIIPRSWGGSLAEVLTRRLPLLDELATLLGAAGCEMVRQVRQDLANLIELERRRDLEEHRRENERFE